MLVEGIVGFTLDGGAGTTLPPSRKPEQTNHVWHDYKLNFALKYLFTE